MLDPEDDEEFKSRDTDESKKASLTDMLEEFFCPDMPGDVDSLDLEDDNEYYSHPLYQKKYGLFNAMASLFNKASSWEIERAERSIRSYIHYTRPEDVSTSALCCYLFRSHMDRHPDLIEESDPNTESAKGRFTGDETELTSEDGELLNRLLATYDFGDLLAETAVIATIYDMPETFSVEDFSAEVLSSEALELVRIDHVSIVEDDLEFLSKRTEIDDYVESAAIASLDMLSQLGDSENAALYDKTWELIDDCLDVYSLQLTLKEEARAKKNQDRRDRYHANKQLTNLLKEFDITRPVSTRKNQGPRI